MNLLLLGGNSKHNKSWILQVQEIANPLFSECRIHEYSHWQTGAPFIDFDHELSALPTTVSGLSPYMVFAKSAGVVLAARAIASGDLAPEACLFVGVPMGLVANNQPAFTKGLTQAAQKPLLIAQNTTDPAGAAADVRAFLDGQSLQSTFRELPGTTHDYTDLKALEELLGELLGSRQ